MIGRRKNSNRVKLKQMSDMNVTPMIDVMLVLLVIFMVTAPFLTVGVKVNLPKAAAENIKDKETPIVINIKANGKIFFGDVNVDENSIIEKLEAIASVKKEETKIFVRGDESLSYGSIMSVIGKISASGFKKVVLITELPSNVKK